MNQCPKKPFRDVLVIFAAKESHKRFMCYVKNVFFPTLLRRSPGSEVGTETLSCIAKRDHV